jgi:hypothetical protein
MAKDTKTSKKEDDPCWDGYQQIGMKTKEDKKVPNCVPDKKAKSKKSDK